MVSSKNRSKITSKRMDCEKNPYCESKVFYINIKWCETKSEENNGSQNPWIRAKDGGERKRHLAYNVFDQENEEGWRWIFNRKVAKKLPSKIATRERLGVTRGAFYRVMGYPKWHLIRNLRMGRSLKSWLSRWTIRGRRGGPKRLKRFTSFAT